MSFGFRKYSLTREIQVFKAIKENNEYKINPFYLMLLLSHQLTQKQLITKLWHI